MSDIRAMIRDILRDELSKARQYEEGAAHQAHSEVVHVANDADLNRFAKRIASMARDPHQLTAIENGSRVFHLGDSRPQVNYSDPAAPRQLHRTPDFEKGLVTEKHIVALDDDVQVIRIGQSVCLTPLAKDELRRRRIKIERVKQ